ncbi:MAG: hypothetical protein COW62_01120 [Zetaproteobacteria bacterium CG17_big_fil_post_rev_8_21_14_2_50_50_13]|nr:MAG: hypothetical protein COW62_01120 [Zetaproteobacteria bacterium CG17_big_fil_post_rev_8_21_14_2_50_50_13]
MSDSKRSLRTIEGGLDQQLRDIFTKHYDPNNPDLLNGFDKIIADLDELNLRRKNVAHLKAFSND